MDHQPAGFPAPVDHLTQTNGLAIPISTICNTVKGSRFVQEVLRVDKIMTVFLEDTKKELVVGGLSHTKLRNDVMCWSP